MSATFLSSNATGLPVLIRATGERAQYAAFEFFATQIRNPHTRKAYLQGVHLFSDWCQVHGLALERVDALAVAAFVEGHTGSVATIRLHMSALRRLFDHLVVKGVLASNPALAVRPPRERRRVGKTPCLQDDELRLLFASFGRDVVSLRDKAIVATMFYTFARVSAVVNLKVEDFKQVGTRTQLHLYEKGSIHHPVPVHHRLEEYLRDYLDLAGHGGLRQMPLFRSARGSTGALTERPLERFHVYDLVKRRCRQAGLGEEFSCHSFRASGITNFRKQGGTLDMAKRLAGHASADTTSLYDRSFEEISQGEVERIRV